MKGRLSHLGPTVVIPNLPQVEVVHHIFYSDKIELGVIAGSAVWLSESVLRTGVCSVP